MYLVFYKVSLSNFENFISCVYFISCFHILLVALSIVVVVYFIHLLCSDLFFCKCFFLILLCVVLWFLIWHCWYYFNNFFCSFFSCLLIGFVHLSHLMLFVSMPVVVVCGNFKFMMMATCRTYRPFCYGVFQLQNSTLFVLSNFINLNYLNCINEIKMQFRTTFCYQHWQILCTRNVCQDSELS